MPFRFSPLLAAALFLTLSGCLPTCVREEDRSLTPADSSARRLARAMAQDTLTPLWGRTPGTLTGLAYPRTVRFDSAGTLWMTDAKANTLTAFAASGAVTQHSAPGLSVPYLAGFRGDTVVVFSAGANRFDLVLRGRRARSIPVTMLPSDKTLVRYGSVWGDSLVVKVGSAETSPRLLVLGPDGRLGRTIPLAGPHWRHAGPLRTQGDTLLSICGFRPLYDRIAPDGTRDSVTLVGFDSPMLSRSGRFVAGTEHIAPLLLPALARVPDGRVFALNLRLGWVQIDVYGPDARLSRTLIQPHPGPDRKFMPEDLDAWVEPSGAVRLAVTSAQPRAEVRLYRWIPPR